MIGVTQSRLNDAAIARRTGGMLPQNINFAVRGEAVLKLLYGQGIRIKPLIKMDRKLSTEAIAASAKATTVLIYCYRD